MVRFPCVNAAMNSVKFNEDSRVKVPVVMQLLRLGYSFLSRDEWEKQREPRTNILRDVFAEAYVKLNAGKTETDARHYIDNVLVPVLDNDDLGRQFYRKLEAQNTGEVLVDFSNFDNNSFHVATEVDCTQDGEGFRPDVTVFVNGLPLAFYEVKKPDSKEQMKAECDRMARRNARSCFRRYMNAAQVMLFSGNQEYDDGNRWQGSFYCTASKGRPQFNFLREKPEVAFVPQLLKKPSAEDICKFLRDAKLAGYEHTPEFQSSIDPGRPAARFATSLLARDRFGFILKFGIAFVETVRGGALHLEKHIMRYPQLFASLRLRKWLEAGSTRGTIWHTQGSGKTALVYHSVKNLTDYYGEQGIVPKFFFVVDRIDLADQVCSELGARGLHIMRAENRKEFDELLRSQSGKDGDCGKDEINVVNIQRFKSDGGKIVAPYGTKIKRVFFIDEAHRSYKPNGSFLGALLAAEADSIYIGLTGTPKLSASEDEETREAFLKREKATREIFGGYIDTYYYNQSIQDGYTLRLLHEVVETQYRVILEEALQQVKIVVGDGKKRKVLYAHEKFVTPLTQYIVTDLLDARKIHGDGSIGGMVVCDTADQARAMMKVLAGKHPEIKAALILHDEGTKEERRAQTDRFKNGELDLLVVFNMLLTGFDAPRLKKLYMGRIVKEHNLLQTLARVNRPYGDWKYGHVVDFADIRKAFDAANAAYLEELKKELGGDWDNYDALFHTREEIEAGVAKMKDYLWRYRPDNLAHFEQMLETADKKELQQLHRTLAEARELRASIIGGGYDMSLADIDRFIRMEQMVSDRLGVIYTKEAWAKGTETEDLLEAALNCCLFAFKRKGDPVELKMADELIHRFLKVKGQLGGCFDRKDAAWVQLNEELRRIFGEKGFKEMSAGELEVLLAEMDEVERKLKQVLHQEQIVLRMYDLDAKYARLHRYLLGKYPELGQYERSLVEALNQVRSKVDGMLEDNADLINNGAYFKEALTSTVWLTMRAYAEPQLSKGQKKDISLTIYNEYTGHLLPD